MSSKDDGAGFDEAAGGDDAMLGVELDGVIGFDGVGGVGALRRLLLSVGEGGSGRQDEGG